MDYDLSFMEKSNLTWLKQNTIYLTVAGSHSYGTNIATSDIDLRGIAIAPMDYYTGFNKRFEQAIFKDPDAQIFDIVKFFKLASNANPNALEIIFTDPKFHLIKLPIFDLIYKNRHKFLSKRAKSSMKGYAKAQLQRMQSHYELFNNPVTEYPKRSDFDLPDKPTLDRDQYVAAESIIQKKLDSWNPDLAFLESDVRKEIEQKVTEMLNEIGAASIYIEKNKLWLEAALVENINVNVILAIKKEKEYKNKVKQYNQYQEWKANRNETRAALEAKYSYDCYSNDTEFLTDNGWKFFDEITNNDKLATLFIKQGFTARNYLGVEYQKYIDKFSADYTGNLYNFTGNHLDVLVTPNHKMLCKAFNKNTKKEDKDWSFIEAANVPNCFNFVNAINAYNNWNNLDSFNFPKTFEIEDLIKLIGWYLSDGSMSFKDKISPDGVQISQKKYGKLYNDMEAFNKKYPQTKMYSYERNSSFDNKTIETTLYIKDKDIVDFIYDNFSFKKEKHFPRWVFNLPLHLKKILIDALCLGDGTVRNTSLKTSIYYSTLKLIANGVQELALLAGYETSLYGPYKQTSNYKDKEYSFDMYQVHINKNPPKTKTITRCINVSKQFYENTKIVCFTVPNGNLIIRRNGHVSFQGNSKHALHLIRLFGSCYDLLTTGDLIVSRPDAKHLLEIRGGKYTYEELMVYAKELEDKVNDAYLKTSLPEVPDINFLNDLCCEIIKQHNS